MLLLLEFKFEALREILTYHLECRKLLTRWERVDVPVREELCQRRVDSRSPQVSNIPREELDMQGRSTTYTKKGKQGSSVLPLPRHVGIVLCYLLEAFQAFQYAVFHLESRLQHSVD